MASASQRQNKEAGQRQNKEAGDTAWIDSLFLERCALFEGVTPHALTDLAVGAVRQTYTRGAIIRARDAGRHDIVLVARGLAALYRVGRDGQELLLDPLCPGDAIGFASDEAKALLTGTLVYRLPVPLVRRLMATSPPFAAAAQATRNRRLARAEERVAEFATCDSATRLGHMLARLAERLGREVTVTRVDLAGLIAAQPEEVSRGLAKLAAQGLVDKSSARSVVVLDRAGLAAL